MSMDVPFVTCDVFTDERFGGNPLAVVFEAAALEEAQMQAIAAEFNYSETVFVLPAKVAGHTARLRIFTPRAEMAFAGHPTIGAALMMADLELVSGDAVIFEEVSGLVHVRLIDTPSGRQAELEAPEAPRLSLTETVGDIAASSGLPSSAISTLRHQPVVASAGTEFLFVELAEEAQLERLRPTTAYNVLPGTGVFFYARTGDGQFSGRMFAPKVGVVEDPATGSAAAALAGLLASLEPEDGVFSWTLEQGIDMGRPSLMTMGAERRDGVVTKATVAGGAVAVSRGMMTVE
jgi:trans-2,3-dihydro-3-hydroxyanthranilate isomerase